MLGSEFRWQPEPARNVPGAGYKVVVFNYLIYNSTLCSHMPPPREKENYKVYRRIKRRILPVLQQWGCLPGSAPTAGSRRGVGTLGDMPPQQVWASSRRWHMQVGRAASTQCCWREGRTPQSGAARKVLEIQVLPDKHRDEATLGRKEKHPSPPPQIKPSTFHQFLTSFPSPWIESGGLSYLGHRGKKAGKTFSSLFPSPFLFPTLPPTLLPQKFTSPL